MTWTTYLIIASGCLSRREIPEFKRMHKLAFIFNSSDLVTITNLLGNGLGYISHYSIHLPISQGNNIIKRMHKLTININFIVLLLITNLLGNAPSIIYYLRYLLHISQGNIRKAFNLYCNNVFQFLMS
jgi:hypothetical protein